MFELCLERPAKQRTVRKRRRLRPQLIMLEERALLTTLVNTTPAISVSATGATLNGSVNALGTTAAETFQYSTDPMFTPTVIHIIGSGFNHPGGVAVDGAGDVFVSDTDNSFVKEVLPGGTINKIGSGWADPIGVAVDSSGDVFVSDIGPRTDVTEVLPGGTMTTIGSGYTEPYGVAVDASGDVFVADTVHNAVKEVMPDGTIKPIGSGYTEPYGVAVDTAGDVFVADLEKNVVDKVTPGGTMTTIGSGFSEPAGVAVDASGDVFVADTVHNAVKEVMPDGTIKPIGSGFDQPAGVAVDASGDVFVADSGNNAVKEVMPDGTVKPIGTGFNDPQGVAVDAAGDVFVADTFNNRIVEISPQTVAATPSPPSVSDLTAISGTLTGLSPGTTYYFRAVASGAGGIVVGSTESFTTLPLPTVTTTPAGSISATGATLNGSVNPNGSSVTTSFQYSTDPTFTPTVEGTYIGSGFRYPSGVAVDSAGDVFVADILANAVKEVLPSGAIKAIGSGFKRPNGVAVDSAGDVFVSDGGNGAIKEVLPSGAIKPIGSGFKFPSGVAVDSAGDVFVADYKADTVTEILPGGTTKIIASGLSGPDGVAVNSAGDVFVSEVGLSAIAEILPGGTIKTIGSGFDDPSGVAVDSAGDLFVADYAHQLVKEVLPDGTIKSLGSEWGEPNGVAVDAAGDLFVADSLDPYIVELSPPAVAAVPSPLGGLAATAISGTLTGLNSGTTYYFRAVASGAGGPVVGSTESFTTLTQVAPSPAPPELIGSVVVSQSRNRTSFTLKFAAPLDSATAENRHLYRVKEGVTILLGKHGATTYYVKTLKIRSVVYDAALDSVTVKLAKPYRGAVKVTIKPGLEAAAGASTTSRINAIVIGASRRPRLVDWRLEKST